MDAEPTVTVCSLCGSVVEELGTTRFYFRCRHCDTRHLMADCTVCTGTTT